MILLWGLPGDTPIVAVRAALHHAGEPVVFLDQRRVLETSVTLSIATEVTGNLAVDGRMLDLSAVRAAYLRPHDSRRVPAVAAAGEGSPAWARAIEIEDRLLSWSELTTALVVNRPSAMASNGSKPLQAALIRAYFPVPDALLTTDPAAVERYWAEHGTVIYKSISGVRSIVSRLDEAHRGRFEQVAWCPTQFQRYVPGVDHRVHVVGDEVFACEVRSGADDYRYAGRSGAAVEIRACELPMECADRCRALAADLGLTVAGIDLRRTPDGAWCCFEVNPSPAFTFYEDATGQPIAGAIARCLARTDHALR